MKIIADKYLFPWCLNHFEIIILDYMLFLFKTIVTFQGYERQPLSFTMKIKTLIPSKSNQVVLSLSQREIAHQGYLCKVSL